MIDDGIDTRTSVAQKETEKACLKCMKFGGDDDGDTPDPQSAADLYINRTDTLTFLNKSLRGLSSDYEQLCT